MADGLNNLYVNDQKERNQVDFEGSGKGHGRYSKNSEYRSNLKAASLFILLDIIAALLFCLVTFMLVKDVYTRANGKYVVMENATVSDKKIEVQYDGKSYSFDPGPSVIVNKDHSIKVYYKGTSFYTGAIMMSVKEYLIGYVLTISGILLFTWRIYKTLHVTNHSAGAVAHGRFDE